MPDPSNETVTVKLPSGESVDAVVPAGMSDDQVGQLMRQKHPEYFPQEKPQEGPVSRFMTSFTGLPVSDIMAHPSAYLNPFSSDYWNKAKQNNSPQAPVTPRQMIPFGDTVGKISNGDYAGAAGNIAGGAVALAPLLSGIGKPEPIPESAATSPSRTMPGQIAPEVITPKKPPPPAPVNSNGKMALPHAPVGAELGGINTPPVKLGAELASIPQPPAPPVYPGAPLPAKPSPELIQSGSLARGVQVPQPEPSAGLGKIPVSSPAPKIATPEPSGPPPVRVQNSPETLSGESALRQVLTGQDNANLLKIAKSRGISVSKESQLKPGVADNLLVNKIIGDFSPEELDEIRSRYMESKRFRHDFGEIGPEAWKTMGLQTFFPDLKIPQATMNRTSAAIDAAKPKPAISVPGEDLTPVLTESVKRAKATKK